MKYKNILVHKLATFCNICRQSRRRLLLWFFFFIFLLPIYYIFLVIFFCTMFLPCLMESFFSLFAFFCSRLFSYYWLCCLLSGSRNLYTSLVFFFFALYELFILFYGLIYYFNVFLSDERTTWKERKKCTLFYLFIYSFIHLLFSFPILFNFILLYYLK